MPGLSKEDKLRLLTTMLESRHADLREQNLNRQGKGHFHVSGMGHEALAAVSIQTEPDDYIVPYYRDRGLILGRGMTTRQLGLEYFAKRNTGSGGRQMPSHYSNADLHIWSVPTPTGSQLLPACGMAWGIQLDGKNNLVVTTVGDAATRQGDFFEALCFAREKKLPMLFLVEDNGYGISMPTRKNNPLALKVLEPDNWRRIEGQDVQQVYDATAEAFEKIRAGSGPFFFWIKIRDACSSAKTLKIRRAVCFVSHKGFQPSFHNRCSIRLLPNRRFWVLPAVWRHTANAPFSNCNLLISFIRDSTSWSQTSQICAGDHSAIGNVRR